MPVSIVSKDAIRVKVAAFPKLMKHKHSGMVVYMLEDLGATMYGVSLNNSGNPHSRSWAALKDWEDYNDPITIQNVVT